MHALQVRGRGAGAARGCRRNRCEGRAAGAAREKAGRRRHGGSALKGRRLQYRHLCMQQQISPSSAACAFPAIHPFASQLLMPTCHAVPLLQVPQAAAAAGRWQVRLGWWTGAVGGGRQNWPEAAKVGEGGKGGGGREVRPGEQGSACSGVSEVWAEHGSSLLPSTGRHMPVS